MENSNTINNIEGTLEWWQSLDGILQKMQETKDENDALREEIKLIKKDIKDG